MNLITEKQAAFIYKLAQERGVTAEANTFLTGTPSRKDASSYIQSLLDKPRTVTAEPQKAVTGLDLRSLPSGSYAAEDEEGVTRFFKIDNVTEGRWAGWVFVKVQASDDLYKQGAQRPNQSYSGKSTHALTAIVADPKAASMRYGQELGRCGVCGRTLTDPDSISKGIGPVCEGRF